MIAGCPHARFRTLGAMPVMVDGIEYLTADEAATALGVKRETLYAYASRGRVRSYRRGTGRARLYRADEIRALTQIRADRPPDYLVDASTWMDGHS
jgi:excisionase family DNA binding protein